MDELYSIIFGCSAGQPGQFLLIEGKIVISRAYAILV
jgi:hypothetical protein